jgi:hypothetical protein
MIRIRNRMAGHGANGRGAHRRGRRGLGAVDSVVVEAQLVDAAHVEYGARHNDDPRQAEPLVAEAQNLHVDRLQRA